MATRNNALSELTRFWLEVRHGCFLRESIPVPVPYGQSDIDFAAIRPDQSSFELPTGVKVGPRIIVETKDEHDWDSSGRDFGAGLLSDWAKMKDKPFIPEKTKGVRFVMLRQEHYELAKSLFGCEDFDRLFVVHAIDKDALEKCAATLEEGRIHWISVKELLSDLQNWYQRHPRPSGLRNLLTGDLFHLLFGFCEVSMPS